MNSFKDFGINTESAKSFAGPKIKIKKVLNKQIVIKDFKIEPSDYENKQRLTLDIEFEGNNHIIWTNSKYLQELIQKVDRAKLPFTTTIIEENERLLFS